MAGILSTTSLPSSPDDLTAHVLNHLLDNSHNWSLGPVRDIKIEPHGRVDSMSAAVYKLNLTPSTGDRVGLIAKLREVGGSPDQQRSSQREIVFYRELAGIAGVASPVTYVAEYDDAKGRMFLVQEYLSDGAVGTIQTFLADNQLKRVLAALAGMHAKWWNTDELSRLNQVRSFDEAMEGGHKRFESGEYSGQRFLEKYGQRVHPEIARVYSSPVQWGPKLQAGFSNNRTLCHYDVAAKNLFLPEDPSRPPVFFDWSLVTRGSIGVELANVLAHSMHVDEHHRIPEMLDFYLGTMRELGVSDLSAETLWNDFRYGLLVRLAAPIALASRGYPPADALALELLPRITSAVLATDALELLEYG
ncbi:MAG: phosphotransferase [Chloroflexi bacterium]|nr:phosphotransferase [Chloroflexota bacterium]